MTNEPPAIDPLAPWPTLHERDSGALPEAEHFEGVPPHLDHPLRAWVLRTIRNQDLLVQRVLTRFRISWTLQTLDSNGIHRRANQTTVIMRLIAGQNEKIHSARPVDQLSIVDAIIGLHPYWNKQLDWGEDIRHTEWFNLLVDLEILLRDSGSAWEVNEEFRGLYRRVDAPVTEAWQRARKLAEESGRTIASRFLSDAWRKIYGQHPDPTDGYTAAVKAVESVTVPLVFPNRPNAIVHHVRNELQRNGEQWTFALAEAETVAAGSGSIDVVATMLDRLLRGETERHGVEGRNRPTTPAEAQAAVHLAAVLVHWFVSGAIQHKG